LSIGTWPSRPGARDAGSEIAPAPLVAPAAPTEREKRQPVYRAAGKSQGKKLPAAGTGDQVLPLRRAPWLLNHYLKAPPWLTRPAGSQDEIGDGADEGAQDQEEQAGRHLDHT
jgi:hypothetical protein